MATATVNATDAMGEANKVILAQKRAFEARMKAKKEKTPAQLVQDTPAQLVVESWTAVMDIVDYEKVAGEILLRRVFELSYDAFRLFPYAKKYAYNDEALYEDEEFVSSSTAVIGTITAAVGLLESGDTDTLDLVLKDVSFRYSKFNESHYNTVGESLLFTLEMALDTDLTNKVKEAWETVFVVVKKQLKKGAVEAKSMEKAKMLEAVVSTDDVEEPKKEVKVPDAVVPTDVTTDVKPVVKKALSFEEPIKEGLKSSITWMLKKDKKNSKSGLTFASKNGIVALKAVEGRAAAKTNLSVGLQVLKIAGQEVKSATEAVKAFASAPVGPVKIMTNGSHHTAKKMSSKEKAGFAIQPYHLDKSLIEIYKVNPSGMFADLTPGHLLWSINGKRIVSVSQGIKLLAKKNILMLVVVDPADLGGISASDVKEPSPSPKKSSADVKEPEIKVAPMEDLEVAEEPNPAAEEPQSEGQELIW
eukprot:CAMPEP_0113609154 /NCGR_PEP_ID=MMETSP0017_2-20120614/4332_1 /TAXON_ID=2856 /ORGANISM="Cylindrotheca closterium" /LENGTH=473 /DNA_ID=CAMNT_0000517937 /DNA_START=44 /DNA_END=1462 /DNA_ORIENTATION=+ /assembly_acc=CAM_ASM_000147